MQFTRFFQIGCVPRTNHPHSISPNLIKTNHLANSLCAPGTRPPALRPLRTPSVLATGQGRHLQVLASEASSRAQQGGPGQAQVSRPRASPCLDALKHRSLQASTPGGRQWPQESLPPSQPRGKKRAFSLGSPGGISGPIKSERLLLLMCNWF